MDNPFLTDMHGGPGGPIGFFLTTLPGLKAPQGLTYFPDGWTERIEGDVKEFQPGKVGSPGNKIRKEKNNK